MEDMDRNFMVLLQDCDNNFTKETKTKSENEDPLGSINSMVTKIEASYYKMDRVVFAEPIDHAIGDTTEGSGLQEDAGEISFIDNVMIKKRNGKRNKYFINIKEGSSNCPLTNCNKTFATTTLLKAHVRKVHCAITKCVCELCGASFAALYLLRRHYGVHSGRRVQCEQCGLWLSERTSLSAHRLTHGTHRPHACAACRRRFLRRSSLRAHRAFVHRDGDVACGSCDARFTSRKQWSLHRATHNSHKR